MYLIKGSVFRRKSFDTLGKRDRGKVNCKILRVDISHLFATLNSHLQFAQSTYNSFKLFACNKQSLVADEVQVVDELRD